MKVVLVPRVRLVSPSARCALGGYIEALLTDALLHTSGGTVLIVLGAPVRGLLFARPGSGAYHFRFRLNCTNYACSVSCLFYFSCDCRVYGPRFPFEFLV